MNEVDLENANKIIGDIIYKHALTGAIIYKHAFQDLGLLSYYI